MSLNSIIRSAYSKFLRLPAQFSTSTSAKTIETMINLQTWSWSIAFTCNPTPATWGCKSLRSGACWEYSESTRTYGTRFRCSTLTNRSASYNSRIKWSPSKTALWLTPSAPIYTIPPASSNTSPTARLSSTFWMRMSMSTTSTWETSRNPRNLAWFASTASPSRRTWSKRASSMCSIWEIMSTFSSSSLIRLLSEWKGRIPS